MINEADRAGQPYQRGGAARGSVGTVTWGCGEMADLKGRPETG
jgi:hypothetical protein